MATTVLSLTGQQLEETLLGSGWVRYHTRGSHRYYRHPNHPGRQLTIPVYIGEAVPENVLQGIVREAFLAAMAF